MSKKGVKLVDQLINNYGQQLGKKKYQEYRKKRQYQMSQKYYIDKFGNELGKIKYQQYLEKTHFCNTQQRFIKKFGQILGKQKWLQYRKKCIRNKEFYVSKYGQELGNIKWNEYRYKQAIKNTFQYKNKVYGWSKQQFKKYNLSRVASLQNYIKKYGQQLGQKKYSSYLRKRCGKSKIALNFFQKIANYNNLNHKIYFGKSEKCIGKQKVGCYFLDFYNQTTNKAIEFYGDFWHCSQMLFQENQIRPIIKKSVKQIRQKDKKRIQYIQSKGILVSIFWQNEIKNQQKVSELIKWVYSL